MLGFRAFFDPSWQAVSKMRSVQVDAVRVSKRRMSI